MKKILAVLFLLFCQSAIGQSVYGFGDSIFNGYGTSNPATKTVPALASIFLGYPLVNEAVNGGVSANGAIIAQGVPITANDLALVNYGANDSQVYFTAPQQQYYAGFMMELAVRLAYPNRVLGGAMIQTPPGSWVARNPAPPAAPDTRFPWSKGYYSNTAGACISGQVSGTTIYVGLSATDWPGGLAAVWPGTETVTVAIDGVVQTSTLTSDWPGSAAGYFTQTSSYPYSARFTTGMPGNHNVSVCLQSGFVYFEYIAGSDQPAGPDIYLFTPSRTYQPADTNAPGPSLAFEQIIFNIANQLTADGRRVHAVDAYPLVGPGGVISDEIHWTDATHLAVFEAWQAVYSPPPPPVAPTYIPAYLCTNGTGYFGAKDMGCTINLQPL